MTMMDSSRRRSYPPLMILQKMHAAEDILCIPWKRDLVGLSGNAWLCRRRKRIKSSCQGPTQVIDSLMRGQLRQSDGGRTEREKKKAVRVSRFERGSPNSQRRGYKAKLGQSPEEWDRLVQNPFLAFYQRWPWFAHYTPLLNLWKILLRHSRRMFLGFFFFGCHCYYLNWLHVFLQSSPGLLGCVLG